MMESHFKGNPTGMGNAVQILIGMGLKEISRGMGK